MHFLVKACVVAVILFSAYVQVLGVAVNPYEYIYITRRQLPYNPLYLPGRPDLRDDMTAQHFIPDFSPLAGHQWLLGGTIRESLFGRAAGEKYLKENFPWKISMPFAVPSAPERGLGWDAWWRHVPDTHPPARAWALPLAAAEAAFALLLLAAVIIQLFKTNAEGGAWGSGKDEKDRG